MSRPTVQWRNPWWVAAQVLLLWGFFGLVGDSADFATHPWRNTIYAVALVVGYFTGVNVESAARDKVALEKIMAELAAQREAEEEPGSAEEYGPES